MVPVRTNRPKLSTPAAADYLGIGKSTLEKRRLWGLDPTYIKIGKRVVYDPDVLDAFAFANERQSTSQAA